MIPLFDMIMQAQNGHAIDVMAKQFGLAQEQAVKAMAALTPAFAEGFKRNASNPYDFAAFMTALTSGNYAKYFEDMGKAFTPQGMAEGNDILGQLFGSKEVSRAIAAQAAQITGIGQEIYKQMLPVMADTIMGGLFKQAMAPFTGGGSASGAGNPMADFMRQWMEATGMAKKPEPAANPFDNPFAQAMQDFLAAAGNAKEGKLAPFAGNPFAKAFQDMMAGMANGGGAAKTSEKPELSANPAGDSFGKLFNTMFDAGVEMQKDYQKNIAAILATMQKPPEKKP
ncbi:MAG: DUF937 domain-containing protein [Shinella sp.]|nr:DUF937 domain-containing protein [Shinella sp.]